MKLKKMILDKMLRIGNNGLNHWKEHKNGSI